MLPQNKSKWRDSRRSSKKYKAKILTGDSTDSYNDVENPNRVNPKEIELNFKNGVAMLPPHSLTIVHIKEYYK